MKITQEIAQEVLNTYKKLHHSIGYASQLEEGVAEVATVDQAYQDDVVQSFARLAEHLSSNAMDAEQTLKTALRNNLSPEKAGELLHSYKIASQAMGKLKAIKENLDGMAVVPETADVGDLDETLFTAHAEHFKIESEFLVGIATIEKELHEILGVQGN